MTGTIGTLLILFCLLQIKHMFADFYLQTPRMLSGRGSYWHMGRAQHAGVHALGSIIVFLLIGAPLLFILALVAVEWMLHFHIDYWKGQLCNRKALDPFKPAFWRATGADQAMHQLTYVAMAWAWVEFAV
ncbi:MAG: DUF3307 domain-containing protein [Pseudodonghicola sp.]|nr:DUF3307 domain-containing protein [Pseudodonghicola sp.]